MFTIYAELKFINKKKENKRLRKLGYIPSIIYVNKLNSISIKIKINIYLLLKHLSISNKIHINLNNNIFLVKIMDIQYHPIKNEIIHIDFLKIKEN